MKIGPQLTEPERYKGLSDHRTTIDNVLDGAYDKIEHDEFTIGGSGALYSKDFRGFLPTLMDSCLLYTSPSPRDGLLSRMPSSA